MAGTRRLRRPGSTSVQVEEALVFFDFSPGAKYRQNAEQTGQHHHQERQTVNRQVDRNAETWDPRQDELRLPLRMPADWSVSNRPATTVAGQARASIPW